MHCKLNIVTLIHQLNKSDSHGVKGQRNMNEELQYITDNSGTQQPAWLHEDGTLVSYWTGLKTLLIQQIRKHI